MEPALDYLKEKGLQNIYAIANDSVSEYIKMKGFTLDDKKPSALLLTYDDQISYEKIVKFTHFLSSDIPYLSTHHDITCPTAKGPIPDVGTFINIFESTKNRSPDKIFGKPNKSLVESTLKKLNLQTSDAVVIGDRIYTDIEMAAKSEMCSILVLTGETTRADYEKSAVKADIVVNSLESILDYL